MPAAVGDGPTVANSFANNFWGKDDAGVDPLLERMHNAKVTMDEVKSFYNTRAAIEEEYAKKMLALCRKPLGSSEAGTLRASLDVVRGEVEAMGRAHQNIAGQMKSELEEPLSAFLGGMRERRKIVQSGIEKLLKLKVQQTQTATKTRDRFEQDCLRIKGYLAQGHMVMGQEERKNKAKLEKTQIQMATNSNDYELAIQALEETTGRWNREWKIACDKFQDLEEERLDFMKSSLWTFANIASTVCVTDDAACERIRLSLENCEVEKDITSFIAEKGSGQEIPDPPKYINFCRGDVNDSASEISVEDAYSVAQFKRTTNPMYRTSSPQPPKNNRDNSAYVGDDDEEFTHRSREATVTPQKAASAIRAQVKRESADIGEVPHNDFPEDGMTMFCRNDPAPSAPSSSLGHNKIWDDNHSEYSGPTSVSSYDMESGKASPVKQIPGNESGISAASTDSKTITKKRSGFFSNSPFRRKSKHEKERPQSMAAPATRNLWGKSAGASQSVDTKDFAMDENEPIDPRASFQVNIGQNVFDVASPLQGRFKKDTSANDDPLAVALAELKVGGKQSAARVTADRYHGLATPAPGQQLAQNNSAVAGAQRGTPPPGYDSPANRLGAPQPAHTRAQMQATTQHYTNQNTNAYGSPTRQNGGSNGKGGPAPRAASPSPMRATSPRPGYQGQQQQQQQRYPEGPDSYRRSASPNPHAQMMSGGPYPSHNNFGGQGHPNPMQRAASPRPQLDDRNRSSMNRAASPRPQYNGHGASSRPGSRDANMALQLSSNEMQGRQSHGHQGQNGGRPSSYYDGPQNNRGRGGPGGQGQDGRMRSKSQVDGRQFTRDGQPILHFARAMYSYSAAIPEELSFQKGDVLAVLRLQDDGWWEAEVKGRNGRPGLVPSNYLQNC